MGSGIIQNAGLGGWERVVGSRHSRRVRSVWRAKEQRKATEIHAEGVGVVGLGHHPERRPGGAG